MKDRDNFYNIFYLVQWASGDLSWEKDGELGEYANLLLDFKKRKDVQSDFARQSLEQQHKVHTQKKYTKSEVKPFAKTKRISSSHTH